MGYIAGVVNNGLEVLNALQEQNFGIILKDVWMKKWMALPPPNLRKSWQHRSNFCVVPIFNNYSDNCSIYKCPKMYRKIIALIPVVYKVAVKNTGWWLPICHPRWALIVIHKYSSIWF